MKRENKVDKIQEYVAKLINAVHDEYSDLINKTKELEKETKIDQSDARSILTEKRNSAIKNLEKVLNKIKEIKLQ